MWGNKRGHPSFLENIPTELPYFIHSINFNYTYEVFLFVSKNKVEPKIIQGVNILTKINVYVDRKKQCTESRISI